MEINLEEELVVWGHNGLDYLFSRGFRCCFIL